MQVYVEIKIISPIQIVITLKFNNEYSEEIEHDSLQMFPYKAVCEYYKRLIDNKIIENGKIYTVDNAFLEKLQSCKNIINIDNIITTYSDKTLAKFEIIKNMDIKNILCTDTIIIDNYNGKSYACDIFYITNKSSIGQNNSSYELILCNENKFMKFLVINNVAFCIKYLYNIIPYIIDVFNNERCLLYNDDCFMFRYAKLTKLYSNSYVNRHVIRDKFTSNNYFDDNNIDIFSINNIINRIDSICNSKKINNKKCEFDYLRKVVYNYFAGRITNKISVFVDKKNLSIDMIKNINLYENYIKLYETFDISLKEELVQSVFHPRRLSYYLDNYNFDINEHF